MCKENKEKLKKQVEKLRQKLLNLIECNDDLTSDEVLKLSTELDKLINKYGLTYGSCDN